MKFGIPNNLLSIVIKQLSIVLYIITISYSVAIYSISVITLMKLKQFIEIKFMNITFTI